MTDKVEKSTGRIVFLDYIRVLACLAVMTAHASEYFYCVSGTEAMVANEQNRFWVALYDGCFSRAAVPLFMIVSAYLLVPMREGQTMTQFYRRRFMRIIPPLVCFLLLYTFLPLLWGGTTWEQSLDDLRLLPFNFPMTAAHLWFMYPLISLYLIIPVISSWLRDASARDERIFLGIFAFTTLIPWLHRFVSPELWGECHWNQYSMLYYCSGFLGYLVLAHYIRKHIKWSRGRRLAVGIACFSLGAVFTAWSFWWKGEPGVLMGIPEMEWSWGFCTPNVVLTTFGLFLLFSCVQKQKAPVVVTELSRLSFGMYLMHMFFLSPIALWMMNDNPAQPLIPIGLAIPAIALLTFLCSAVTTKLLSFLPGSKYVIG